MFSEAGVFYLQQLASLVFKHSGVRHKLSTREGQISLLHAGQSSAQRDIQNCWRQLIATLQPQQKLALEREGLHFTPSLNRQAS